MGDGEELGERPGGLVAQCALGFGCQLRGERCPRRRSAAYPRRCRGLAPCEPHDGGPRQQVGDAAARPVLGGPHFPRRRVRSAAFVPVPLGDFAQVDTPARHVDAVERRAGADQVAAHLAEEWGCDGPSGQSGPLLPLRRQEHGSAPQQRSPRRWPASPPAWSKP